MRKKNKAFFLDRDGTVIYDKGYIKNTRDVKLIAGSAKAIKRMNDKGYLVIIITNQSGIARGIMNLKQYYKVNKKMSYNLAKKGALYDDTFMCPHLPFELGGKCLCRKPKVKLINMAIKKWNIDRNKSFIIGDKLADIMLGINSGIKPVLVTTGYGKKTLKELDKIPKIKKMTKIFKNLNKAANMIIK